MFEWMNRHKQNIMKYTLYLVIPSFIIMYGYGECARPTVYKWVAKVNGAEVSELDLSLGIENLQRQLRTYGQDMPYDEIKQQALERAIVTTLFEQKAQEWGVSTSDEELMEHIMAMDAFKDENGVFNKNAYNYILAANRLHPQSFENEQRDSLTQNKVRAIILNSIFQAASEKKLLTDRQSQKVSVEFLAFEPAAYTDDVSPVTDEMNAFFQEHIEDYRVPDQRRVDYVAFYPADYIDSVSFTERELESFFKKEAQNYEVPEKATVDYITYRSEGFIDQTAPNDDEVKDYFATNSGRYMHPAQVKVRFVTVPLAELASQEQLGDTEVSDYYNENIARYTEPEQVKASHILFKLEPTSSDEEAAAAEKKALEVRQEIVDGLAFAEAAKKYSEGPTGPDGGDLGYFTRERMVPAFSQAAFELPLGQISDPVRTQFGYHLILVADRKEKVVTPLDEVRDSIQSILQKERVIATLKEKVASMTSLDEVSSLSEIKTTDWFSRIDDIEGVDAKDKNVFYMSASKKDTETKIQLAANSQMDNAYLIEPLDSRDRRPKTFEEAYEQVLLDTKRQAADAVARAAAQADMERIQSASLTLEAVADERNLTLQTSPAFSREDQYIPGFGRSAYAMVNAAMSMNPGEVKGPFDSDLGYCLIRLVGKEEPYIPELVLVRSQVEQDLKTRRAEQDARRHAARFSDELVIKQVKMADYAPQSSIEVTSTELFKEMQTIPGLGFKRNINQAAFELKKLGEVSNVIEERINNPGQRTQGPVDAYYVIELKEIKESYLPSFEEALVDVDRDFRLKLAETVAIEKAQKTLDAIKARIASSEPLSVTRTVDLKSFAGDGTANVSDGAAYRGPHEVTGMGSVPGVGRATSFAKTALAMEKGKVSGLVLNYARDFDEDNKPVQGNLTGAYILQVLDHIEPETEDPNMDRFSQMLDSQIGSSAFSAWINEVSAAATIQYNETFLHPQPDGLTEEEEATQTS
jgi:parvulin-like peptidyl-prolyl isomerase